MVKLSKNAITVLEKRYLKKDDNGTVTETPSDMFMRVAETVSTGNKELTTKFYNMMSNLDFLPNSPTLMNAGRELGQLSACFVLPIGDSIPEIFDAVKFTAMIHKSGGGTGFSFSRLRPENDRVKKTNGVSSGPMSFMEVFNTATETIKQGGTRRGANMGMLRVDHPDIMSFLGCKSDPKKFNNFNISIAATEVFMQAVIEGKEYTLINPNGGQPAGTLDARTVFNQAVEYAWKNGEPGIVFIDAMNAHNPTPGIGEFEATNPCVPSDVVVFTDEGPRKVQELIGKPFTAIVNNQLHFSDENGFFSTGIKDVYNLVTKEGYILPLTLGHKVTKVTKHTRNVCEAEWVEAGTLKENDLIKITNSNKSWSGKFNYQEGYLIGLLMGDGYINEDKAVLSLYYGHRNSEGVVGIKTFAEECAMSMPHRQDFRGWQTISGKNEIRLSLSYIKKIAEELGLTKDSKELSAKFNDTSSEFLKGFLSGFFDADGTVIGIQRKGASIRLSQSNINTIQEVQKMLLRFGIVSKAYLNRRKESVKNMPNGHGGIKEYPIKTQHELVISKTNLVVFAENIGFYETNKQAKLNSIISSYKRKTNTEHFIATVKELVFRSTEEVFDVQVPGINAFDANGILAHNCGEQPLLPYESCNLGSINLANFVKDGVVDFNRLGTTVKDAVLFLDNVIDVNKYPLQQIDEMTKSNRKIGLGVMGWADMLVLLGIAYGSDESVLLAKQVMEFINKRAKQTSTELSRKRGCYPNWENSVHADVPTKMRNATVTTIAPTGTISMIANASSGVEPLFAVSFTRNQADTVMYDTNPIFEKIAKEQGFWSKELLDKISDNHGSVQGLEEVPKEVQKAFITAHDLTYKEHVYMQAAFQEHVDNAVSKTINFSFDATIEDVSNAYMLAYKTGCKGITIYRDGSRDEQVLSTGTKKEEKVEVVAPVETVSKKDRPRALRGTTYQMQTGCGPLYVTVNEDDEGPFELFTTMGKAGGCAASQAEALGRMISLAWRSGSGVSPRQVIKQLTGISCHCPAGFGDSKITSCADAVAKAIQMHIEADIPVVKKSTKKTSLVLKEVAKRGACPECGGMVEHEGGCCVCHSCGYSECA